MVTLLGPTLLGPSRCPCFGCIFPRCLFHPQSRNHHLHEEAHAAFVATLRLDVNVQEVENMLSQHVYTPCAGFSGVDAEFGVHARATRHDAVHDVEIVAHRRALPSENNKIEWDTMFRPPVF